MRNDQSMRLEAIEIFQKAIKKIDQRRMILDRLTVAGRKLKIKDLVYDLDDYETIRVISVGKAAHLMAFGLEECLGEFIDEGIVLSNNFSDPLPEKYRLFKCTHPLPSTQNIQATEKVLEMASAAGKNDLIICAISGGGSAILSSPAPGISADDKAETVELLLKTGASIAELNTVRKHISKVKGGFLLKAIAPARTLGLYLSDVPNDEISTIASGPTVPDSTTFADACSVIDKFNLMYKIPSTVAERLKTGREGLVEETLKHDSPLLDRCENVIVGRNLDMLLALEDEFRQRGYWVMVEPEHYQGEARDFGRRTAQRLKRLASSLPGNERPYALIMGGETTVTVTGDGIGGRNTEVALSAALVLADCRGCLLLAAGTDGRDGSGDAAGAVADWTSIKRGVNLGLDAKNLLENNDSYNFFKPLSDLIITGPTGTNLMDVTVAIVGTE